MALRALGSVRKKIPGFNEGNRASLYPAETASINSSDGSIHSREDDRPADLMPRQSIIIGDDQTDLEIQRAIANTSGSTLFLFEDDDDDPRGDYNVEVSVFPRNLEDAIPVCRERAKEWANSVQKLLSFLEKKLLLEAEVAKGLVKGAREMLEVFPKEGFNGQGTYYKNVIQTLKSQEIKGKEMERCVNEIRERVFVPLGNKRDDFVASRKRLWSHYTSSQKKYQEATDKAEKAKAKYIRAAQAWEKAVLERGKEQQSNYHQNLEKKTRQETEARSQAEEAEQTLRKHINAANQALERFKNDSQITLSAFEGLLKTSDQKLKEFLLLLSEIEKKYLVSLTPDTDMVESNLNSVDDLKDLQEFIVKVSKSIIWKPSPLEFEKYKMEQSAIGTLIPFSFSFFLPLLPPFLKRKKKRKKKINGFF